MPFDIRSIAEAEITAFRTALAHGFGTDLVEEANDRFQTMIPLTRTIAAFDGADVVGTLGDFQFDVTVPGGAAVPMAGTTMITVRATHRRRGILTSMMRRHLETAAERGDSLAGLWASEAPIYGRYGYGSAVDRHSIQFDAATIALPSAPSDVRVDIVDAETAAKVVPAVYDAVRPARSGMLSRSQAWWANRRFYDAEHVREGRSALRVAIAMRGDTALGYALYRQKEEWDDWIARGQVGIIEVMAVDDDGRRGLFEFLSHIDLFPAVEWWNAPVDHPIVVEASNRRLIQRKIADTLWLRVIDVPRALEARSYETDGRVVMDVADGYHPATQGTFELTVDGGIASCRRTSSEAQVSLTAEDLGAIYLGGRSVPLLAAAGRIKGDTTDVALLDRMFRTSLAPWCPEVF
jgi:predicted acetyltransferase